MVFEDITNRVQQQARDPANIAAELAQLRPQDLATGADATERAHHLAKCDAYIAKLRAAYNLGFIRPDDFGKALQDYSAEVAGASDVQTLQQLGAKINELPTKDDLMGLKDDLKGLKDDMKGLATQDSVFQLGIKLDNDRAKAHNLKLLTGESEAPRLRPLKAESGPNQGQQHPSFPRTTSELEGLSRTQLDSLGSFYGESWGTRSTVVEECKKRFKRFIAG